MADLNKALGIVDLSRHKDVLEHLQKSASKMSGAETNITSALRANRGSPASRLDVIAAAMAGGMVAMSKDSPTPKQAVDFFEAVLTELKSRAA